MNPELERLKNEKAALQAQVDLLENFIDLARSSAESHMMTAVLRRAVSVAAELCDAETGSLFLLDEAGVVTDSILTREDASEAQRSAIIGTVLDRGLAGWVMRHRRVGLVADTLQDDRWLELPGQPYRIRSAMAVPIARGESLLGILTLQHSRPGHFTAEAADRVALTARQMALALENARLYATLDRYARALDHELEKGKRIQLDFLPAALPRLPGWEIQACFHPARRVSGDFYDVFQLPDGTLVASIGDVCDKGVGSALFMALVRSLLRIFCGRMAPSGLSLSERRVCEGGQEAGAEAGLAHTAVSLTNCYIAREHESLNMFTTLFLGVLNPTTGHMAYVNAGHEPPLVLGPRGVRKRLTPTGTILGVLSDAVFEVAETRIAPGETLLGYTDGVLEALSPEGAQYTKQRLYRQLLAEPCAPAGELIDRVKADLFAHIRHAPQYDDITMIALHRQASAATG